MTFSLKDFVIESNMIEGIVREAAMLDREIKAHEAFLANPLSVKSLCKFVSVVQPGAVLRDKKGLNVRVGDYVAPDGGPQIKLALIFLLQNAVGNYVRPYYSHVGYEVLHPFTDGNGRSGRALWLWAMSGKAPLGFLHHFYYQTLEGAR